MDIFEIELNALEHRFVNDHIVSGITILPAAAYVELVLANFEYWNPETGVVMKRVKINTPMVFQNGETKKVQIKYEYKGDVYNFSVSSMDETSRWLLHVEGQIQEKACQEILKPEYPQYKNNHGFRLNKDEVYEMYRKAELQYGDFYRCIDSILINDKDVYAELNLNKNSDYLQDYFIVNPALLDCAFQAAAMPSFYESEDSIFLPYYIEELIYTKSFDDSIICISNQRKSNFDNSQIKKYDICLCDKNNATCVQIKGLTIKSVGKQKQKNNDISIPQNSFKSSKYIKLNSDNRNELSIQGENCIIFCKETALAEQLSKDIKSNGANPLIIKAGNEFRQVSENSFLIRDNLFEDYKKVFNYFFSKYNNISRIIHLTTISNFTIENDTFEDFEKRLDTGLLSIFNIVKAFKELKNTNTGFLNVITSNAFLISDEEEICCENASISGLVKSLNMENTGLSCSVSDIDSSFSSEEELSHKVLKVICNKKAAVNNVIRNNDWYVPISESIDLLKNEVTDIKEGGVYVIIGGCGGIGLSLAEFIGKYKNVKIVLLNRTRYPEKQDWKRVLDNTENAQLKSKIKRLVNIEINGAKLFLYTADICNYEDMSTVMGSIEKEVGKINGIIHAAGGLRDKLIVNMSSEDFSSVLKPKVHGLWILDKLLKSRQLDFLILCSSIVSVIGNRGQANYAAANSYMDAFASKSYKNIKKVISINWSTWTEGMASEEVLKANENMGLISISKEMGVEAFKRILGSSYKNIAFVPTKEDKFDFDKVYLKVMGIDNISESVERTEKPILEEGAINAVKSKDAIQQDIIEILSIKLALDAVEFDSTTSFTDYGIDSINASEIVEAINIKFNMEIDPTIFFEYKNVEEISDYIIEGMHEGNVIENPKKDFSDKNYEIKVQDKIKIILSEVLSIDIEEIDGFAAFSDYGVDSIIVGNIVERIIEEFKVELEPTVFFEYKNINELSDYVAQITTEEKELHVRDGGELKEESKPIQIDNIVKEPEKQYKEEVSSRDIKTVYDDSDIAIIGYSCRLPGAANIEEFWSNLAAGVNKVEEIPYDRIDWQGYISGLKEEDSEKVSCRWGGFVKDVDKFDAAFFGISPNEAKVMDPQQRVMLELAWEALETSGYAQRSMNTDTGVFVGSSYNCYEDIISKSEDTDSPFLLLGNKAAVIANRISYSFGLQGPSEHVATLCSSSLIAVTSACDSIRSGMCSMALAGGIRLLIPPEHYMGFSQLSLLSSDGKCKAFDKSANGVVPGEGGGFVMLKSAKKALRDGDTIYGVIKGYAVNNNGKSNGLMAPNPKAQEQLLLKAYGDSGVNPSDLWYVETNGTGTLYGDSLEIKALTNVFSKYTDKKSFCAIGALKTNIGHLEPASGIAGILKALMSFKYGLLTPNLNFNEPNALAKLEDTPFFIADKVTGYDRKDITKTVAVSSFGMGGSNAHVILQQPVGKVQRTQNINVPARTSEVILLSARTKEALLSMVNNLKNYLAKNPNYITTDHNIEDISYTLGVGRKHFNKRIALVCKDVEQLKDKLEIISLRGLDTEIENNNIYSNCKEQAKQKGSCLFVFPNEKNLDYETTIKNITALFMEEEDFKQYYQKFVNEAGAENSKATLELLETKSGSAFTTLTNYQLGVAVTAYQYALAVLFMKWGIKPKMAIGAGRGAVLADIIKAGNQIYNHKYVFEKVIRDTNTSSTAETPMLEEKYDIAIDFGTVEPLYRDDRSQYCETRITAGSRQVSGTKFIHDIVAKLYSSGCEINWSDYFKSKGQIIPLPTYPFEDKRYWVTLKALKDNTNKVQRVEQVQPNTSRAEKVVEAVAPIEHDTVSEKPHKISGDEIKDKIIDIFLDEINKSMGYEKEEIDINETLDCIGFDSIISGKVIARYENSLNMELDPIELFEYNTINKYAEFLLETYGEQLANGLADENVAADDVTISEARSSEIIETKKTDEIIKEEIYVKSDDGCYDIAVIGLAGRFPGTEEAEEFFGNLCEGHTFIKEIPKDRWNIEEYYSDDPEELGKTDCRYGSFIDGIDKFDPAFFGISVNKAAMIDPQQRLMLEVAWRAVEDAGYSNGRLAKTKTGVYIGICNNEYAHLKSKDYKNLSPHLASGNTFSIVANRISYVLDVTGPSLAVDTACSSSMVALHNACRDILQGECEMGLVGGVNLTLAPDNNIIFSKARLLSTDGKVRPFDDYANGYIRGEGVGAVLLKPLSKAIEAGDNIHAVIKSTSVMHAGQTNGLNTPSPVAQKKTILEAYKKSGINAETISYIEAHGTGTKLGDYTEFKALADAFKQATDKKQFCAIATTKGNIGHCESAAGIMALIKVIMALKKRKLPPLLNFNKANRKINLAGSPFYINDKLSDWKPNGDTRRAGINCFGFGGTNAHVVVEEYIQKPLYDVNECNNNGYLLVLSSQNENTMTEIYKKIINSINRQENRYYFSNLCYTLSYGRAHHKYRVAVESDSIEGIKEKLQELVEKGPVRDRIFYGHKEKTFPERILVLNEAIHKQEDVLNFYNSFSLYRDSFDSVLKELPAKYIQYIKDFIESGELKASSNNDFNVVLTIIHNFCIFNFLFSLGISFKGIYSLGTVGVFSSLIISKIVKFNGLEKLITDELTIINLNDNQTDCKFMVFNGENLIALDDISVTELSIKDLTEKCNKEALAAHINGQSKFELTQIDKISTVSLFRAAIANFYVKGTEVNWKNYYLGQQLKIVSAPGYIFNRKKYWHT